MTQEITCPADGCDYGENGKKSVGSVKSHINASSGPEHQNKTVLRSAVEEQAAAAAATSEEDSSDEPQESADEQAESDESEPEESDEEEEETEENEEDMATDTEYQQQQQDAQDGQTDDSTDGSDDADAPAKATSAGLVSILPGRSPVMWLGVALLALLLVSMYVDSGSSEPETPTTQQATQQPATPTEAAEQRGGIHE